MKKQFKVWLKYVALVLILCLGIIVKFDSDAYQFQQEVIKIVKSKQAQKLLEKEIRKLEKKRVDPNWEIKKYQIVKKSIQHNPMGGIDFEVIINNDKNLTAGFSIQRDTIIYVNGRETLPMTVGPYMYSADLAKKVARE